jgi:hypothetical protein
VNETSFPTGSNVATITFGGLSQNTQNPVFLPSDYGLGGNTNAPNVSFGGLFLNQSLFLAIVKGNTTSPLTLDPEAPPVYVLQAVLMCALSSGPFALLLSHPVPALQVSHMPGIKQARRQLTGHACAHASAGRHVPGASRLCSATAVHL